MTSSQTIIFVGRSGSGKGTQISLLKKYLQEQDYSNPVFHFSSGDYFRNFIKAQGYTNEGVRELLREGKLVPDFLTNWIFTNALVEKMTDKLNLILDGYPRTIEQTENLNQVLDYYQQDKVLVFNIDVSEDEVQKRMTERGRGDDAHQEVIKTRMAWYRNNVLPTLNLLRSQDRFTVIDINGEGDVQNIHLNIIKKFKDYNNQ